MPYSFLVSPLEKQECTPTKIAEKIFCAVLKVEATKAFLFLTVMFQFSPTFHNLGPWAPETKRSKNIAI